MVVYPAAWCVMAMCVACSGTPSAVALLLGPVGAGATSDAELQRLAGLYAQTCAGGVRAPRTLAKYAKPWEAFIQWFTARQGMAGSAFTAPGAVVAMYLLHLWETSKHDNIGPSRVLTASNAISHFIELFGFPSPTGHPLCVSVREFARRQLHATKRSKDAIDAHDIRLLVDRFAAPGASLLDLMHVTMFVLMFSALLRFDDAAEVSVHADLLMVKPTHLEIFLPRSKTDQIWEGTWTVAAAVPGAANPVALVERLLHEGGYQTVPTHVRQDVGPLLRPVLAIGSGKYRLKRLVGTVEAPVFATEYSRMRDRLQYMCKAVGITKCITLHSMRIGGASEAAAAGCPDRLIMKQGRWASEVVKNHYVRESLDHLLAVSRAVWS